MNLQIAPATWGDLTLPPVDSVLQPLEEEGQGPGDPPSFPSHTHLSQSRVTGCPARAPCVLPTCW